MKPLTVCALALATSLPLLAGCAAHSSTRKAAPSAAMAAERMMHNGQLDSARAILTLACDSLAGTPAGADAQYLLAYMEVFYGNASPNWRSATTGFKRFVTENPGHPREAEANSWIRLLSAYQYRSPTKVQSDTTEAPSIGVRSLAGTAAEGKLLEAIQRCYTEKDSLKTRIRLLEDVIETIEKNN